MSGVFYIVLYYSPHLGDEEAKTQKSLLNVTWYTNGRGRVQTLNCATPGLVLIPVAKTSPHPSL